MSMIKYFLLIVLLFHKAFQTKICPCDIKNGLCDLLCCCDPDCSTADINAFKCQNQQEEQSSNGILKACVPKNLVFRSNTPFIINTISSLFCVEYKEVSISTNDSYLISEEDLHKFPFYESMISLNTNKTFFDISDYLWVVDDQNQISYLTSQKKNDLAPFHYLKNRKKKFIIDLNNSTDIKNETKMFDNFKIIQNPQFENNCSNLTNLFETCSSLIEIKKNCLLNNIIENCSSINDTLFISSYHLVIEYSNPNGIKSAIITYEFLEKILFNLTNNPYFTQEFNLEFKNVNYNPTINYVLGYTIGSFIPIFYNNQSDSKSISILKPSVNCDPSLRIPIEFGKNTATECILTVEKLSNLAETCQLLGHKVKNIQLENGILVNLVAPYQNLIKYNSQEELIQVENLFEGSNFEAIFDSCKQMATSLSIQIAYAKVGNVLKPLNKIVNVKYRWIQSDLELNCLNKKCTDKIKVSTYVNFVDASQTAKFEKTKFFKSSGIISNEFFAPFTNLYPKYVYSNLQFILLTSYFCIFFYL